MSREDQGSGASRQSVGKLSSSMGECEVPSPLLTLGVGESWFLFLFFFLSLLQTLGLWGQGD